MKPGETHLVHINGEPFEAIVDEKGTLRFKRNNVVRDLADQGIQLPNALDYNKIWEKFYDKEYTIEEVMELYRLIGYSIFGFWEVFGWIVNVDGKHFSPVTILVNREPYPPE